MSNKRLTNKIYSKGSICIEIRISYVLESLLTLGILALCLVRLPKLSLKNSVVLNFPRHKISMQNYAR